MGGHQANPFAWPAEACEMLEKLRAERLTTRQIMHRLNGAFPGANLSRCAVLGKIHRLRLPLPTDLATAKGRNPRLARISLPRPAPARPVARPPIVPESVSMPIAKPAPPPPEPPAPGKPIPLLDLGPKSCRWPVVYDDEHGWLFCGKPRDPRSPT